jgi:PadR family transcriptional regulator, regulatory protein PadR
MDVHKLAPVSPKSAKAEYLDGRCKKQVRNGGNMRFRRELVGSTTATLILSVLNTGSAHGYEIVRRINELSNGIFEWQEGTIYPALHKLEAKDLIRGEWVEAASGKMRRVYSLTDDGKRALVSDANEWSLYSGAVKSILDASYA